MQWSIYYLKISGLGPSTLSCDPWQNVCTNFFVDVYASVDAVFHGFSNGELKFLGAVNFHVYTVEILEKMTKDEGDFFLMLNLQKTRVALRNYSLIMDFVERTSLYRMRPIAPQTDGSVLRKIKSTE